MSINCDNELVKPQKRNLWKVLFPHTITNLTVNDVVVAHATTTSGPPSVDVKEFLKKQLKPLPLSILDENILLRMLVHRSLGSKSTTRFFTLEVYIEMLQEEIVTTDLLLCACLLQSDSLQLPDGRFFQTSKISLK